MFNTHCCTLFKIVICLGPTSSHMCKAVLLGKEIMFIYVHLIVIVNGLIYFLK